MTGIDDNTLPTIAWKAEMGGRRGSGRPSLKRREEIPRKDMCGERIAGRRGHACGKERRPRAREGWGQCFRRADERFDI